MDTPVNWGIITSDQVVVSIIALLVSILLSALYKVREQDWQNMWLLKKIYLGTKNAVTRHTKETYVWRVTAFFVPK